MKTGMADWRCTAAQTTLKTTASLAGIGVHSGRSVRVTLRPAAAGSGIVWRRTDVPAAVALVRGRWDRVTSTRLSTVLSNRHGVSVGTVEHLLAALHASGVDNLLIDIDGTEVPILDGSAAPWMALVAQAGVVRQAARRRQLRVLRPVQVDDRSAFVRVSPADTQRFSVEIDFADPAVGRQARSIELEHTGFDADIAPARTFGFLPEIDALRAQGLALGGSLDNAVVVDNGRVLNAGGLRFADEFVRHKILDCVGDLYLAGAPLIGHVEARRPGHALNNRLLRALFAQPDAWAWETCGAEARYPADTAPPGRLVA